MIAPSGYNTMSPGYPSSRYSSFMGYAIWSKPVAPHSGGHYAYPQVFTYGDFRYEHEGGPEMPEVFEDRCSRNSNIYNNNYGSSLRDYYPLTPQYGPQYQGYGRDYQNLPKGGPGSIRDPPGATSPSSFNSYHESPLTLRTGRYHQNILGNGTPASSSLGMVYSPSGYPIRELTIKFCKELLGHDLVMEKIRQNWRLG